MTASQQTTLNQINESTKRTRNWRLWRQIITLNGGEASTRWSPHSPQSTIEGALLYPGDSVRDTMGFIGGPRGRQRAHHGISKKPKGRAAIARGCRTGGTKTSLETNRNELKVPSP